MLTREEIDLERDLERAAEGPQVPQGDVRDYEVQNGRTAARDALKDRSGPGWGDFQMERRSDGAL